MHFELFKSDSEKETHTHNAAVKRSTFLTPRNIEK